MATDTILAKVREVTVEVLNVDEQRITMEASFVKDLGADDMDAVELVFGFEDAFNITIPETAAEKLVTVKDVVEYVVRCQEANKQSAPTD